jgi:catechol 2,3-dioxygenase-like lactoylglutathione lyase family enzyme
MTGSSVVNHLGHCVADLERARRFYTEVFGFEVEREIALPDQPSAKLLRLAPPLGLRALYLRRDGLVRELMEFGAADNPPARERVVNEPGLTHVSFCVDDVAETGRLVTSLGGSVLEETDLGGRAVFVRDPDGQLIELLPMSYRSTIDIERGP